MVVGGEGTRRVQYGELDRDARRMAGWLGDRYGVGERVLVQQRDARLFAVSLLGSLYAGLTAVPAPALGGAANVERRVLALGRDAAVCAVLTGAEDAGEASKVLALGGYGHVDCVAVDTLLEQGHTPDAGDWRPPAVHGHDPALLQYTSGSTQVPRGVVIQHRHLLANQAAIRRALGTGPDSVFGGWLPLHHDMGLIGQLLHPLFLGATAVVMTPEAFVRDPGRWPRMVAEHGVQVSGAPNFGYQLVVDRVRDRDLAGLDLSGWEIAVNGGEPVRASTMRAFQDRFGRHGLRPGALRSAYGLAEATLMVSVSGPGGAQATLDVDRGELERGRVRPAAPGKAKRGLSSVGPVRDLQVRIVDPEAEQPVEDGAVGEVWLRGPSIGADYWRRPPGTTGTFHGTVDAGGADWLRTGDLGLLHDGELYVTGRLSELIIVAGRNLHPLDVERSVQRVSAAFGAGVAFAVEPEEEPEQIVVVQEVRAVGRRRGEASPNFAQLATAIRERVAEDFAVRTGGVVLVRPGTVRRTTSGKLERIAVRNLFLGGRIEALYELVDPPVQALVRARAKGPRRGSAMRAPAHRSEDTMLTPGVPRERREAALRTWLGTRLGRHLRHPAIAHDAVLFELGLDSVAALGLCGDIEARFGLPVAATVAFDHPTIGDLAAYLADRLEAAGPDPGTRYRAAVDHEPAYDERNRP
ncbi:fatty acyl-AMP ligase [Catenulispora yoronensis]|uniref:Fatty acyl-AMP ligase n=1 Tax=Catenulispora yoronensis TaxID=450799 RepID=A0ABP5GTY9_9ACTN